MLPLLWNHVYELFITWCLPPSDFVDVYLTQMQKLTFLFECSLACMFIAGLVGHMKQLLCVSSRMNALTIDQILAWAIKVQDSNGGTSCITNRKQCRNLPTLQICVGATSAANAVIQIMQQEIEPIRQSIRNVHTLLPMKQLATCFDTFQGKRSRAHYINAN